MSTKYACDFCGEDMRDRAASWTQNVHLQTDDQVWEVRVTAESPSARDICPACAVLAIRKVLEGAEDAMKPKLEVVELPAGIHPVCGVESEKGWLCGAELNHEGPHSWQSDENWSTP